MMKNDTIHLRIHEWAVVVVVVSCVIASGITGYMAQRAPDIDRDNSMPMTTETLIVTVEGAVENPGIYTVQRGTTTETLLGIVGLADDADTKRMKMDSKLRNKQKVVVRRVKL